MILLALVGTIVITDKTTCSAFPLCPLVSVILCSEGRTSTRPCPLKGNPTGRRRNCPPWLVVGVHCRSPEATLEESVFYQSCFSVGVLLLVLMLLLQMLFAQFQGCLKCRAWWQLAAFQGQHGAPRLCSVSGLN